MKYQSNYSLNIFKIVLLEFELVSPLSSNCYQKTCVSYNSVLTIAPSSSYLNTFFRSRFFIPALSFREELINFLVKLPLINWVESCLVKLTRTGFEPHHHPHFNLSFLFFNWSPFQKKKFPFLELSLTQY